MSTLTATILLAQLHCAPSASGTVDCWDEQKGGAPVLKIEANPFGGFDLRQSTDGATFGMALANQGRGMAVGTALILIAVGYVAFFHTRRFFKTVGALV